MRPMIQASTPATKAPPIQPRPTGSPRPPTKPAFGHDHVAAGVSAAPTLK
jgi:hypothetical protein